MKASTFPDKLDNIPDAALKDITADIPGTITGTETGTNGTPGVGVVDHNEINKGFEHTKDNDFTGISGQPSSHDSEISGTQRKPGVSPVISTQQDGAKPVNVGSLVGGKFAVDLIDLVFPAAIVLVVDLIGYELDKKGISLTEKEKNIINPAMQDYLNSINVNLNNPLSNLLLVIGTVYGMKIIELIPKMEKKKAKPKPIPKDAPGKLVDMADKILESQKENEQRRAKLVEYSKQLAAMEKEKAVAHIRRTKKLGQPEALIFYNKNVQPLKRK